MFGLEISSVPVILPTLEKRRRHRRDVELAVGIPGARAAGGTGMVAGIASRLRSAAGALPGIREWQSLAARIAAGDLDAVQGSTGGVAADAPAHAALVHGFGWLWWYGALGVLVLAACSWMLFAQQRRTHAQAAQGIGAH